MLFDSLFRKEIIVDVIFMITFVKKVFILS